MDGTKRAWSWEQWDPGGFGSEIFVVGDMNVRRRRVRTGNPK